MYFIDIQIVMILNFCKIFLFDVQMYDDYKSYPKPDSRTLYLPTSVVFIFNFTKLTVLQFPLSPVNMI